MSILSLNMATSGTTGTVVGVEWTIWIGNICSIMSSIGRTGNLHPETQDWQSHTQPKQAQTCIKRCLQKSRDTCRTCSEGSLVWLLGSSWQGHANFVNTFSLYVGWSLLCCLSFETWQLSNRERERGEREWMTTFVWCPATKFWRQKMVTKHFRYDHCCDPQ
jgi:hypothetical protein